MVIDWIAQKLAAKPSLGIDPGWVLGAGQSASLGRRTRKVVWRWMRQPIAVEWIHGLRVTLHPGNEMCKSIFVTGSYEPNEMIWLSQTLKSGMTVIDAGANIGFYSLAISTLVGPSGRVIAVEPSPREMAALRENAKLNDRNNLTFVPAALADREAEVDLMVAAAEKAGHNTLGGFAYNTALDHREKVRTRKLDALVAELALDRVDFIKMDIEGAEHAALRGAQETLRKFRPTLLVEVSDKSLRFQGSSAQELLAFLRELGYSIREFSPQTGRLAPLEKVSIDSQNVVASFDLDAR